MWGSISILVGMAAMMASSYGDGVENPARARVNWMLNCQGCHTIDASGSTGGAPNMVGEVAQFLAVDGGREFLVRVPGVANAPLPDDQLAELVNWMLLSFDAEHLPEGFQPYSAAEIAPLRVRPYIEETSRVRAGLMEKLIRLTALQNKISEQ